MSHSKPEVYRNPIYLTHKVRIDEEKGIAYIPIVNFRSEKVDEAIISLCDLTRVCRFSYHIRTGYRITLPNVKYVVAGPGIDLHAIILGGRSEFGYVIDHINGNPLDNRRENLRRVTSAVNNHNRRKSKGKSSQYNGVHFCKKTKKWISQITVNGKRFFLGSFKLELHAAEVYDAHAALFYGKYARTNVMLKFEVELIMRYGIPDDWRRDKRRLIKFPDYIKKNAAGFYEFTYVSKEFDFSGKGEASTIAECMTLKEQMDEELAREINATKHITRNKDGVAVFKMYYDKRRKWKYIEVDDNVWRALSQYTFNCSGPYAQIRAGGKTYLLHRFIYQKYVGPIPHNRTIDHINSSKPLDNRLINLRLATKSLQTHNQVKRKYSFDKYKGVNYMKGVYHIFIDHHSWGSFQSAEEAAFGANQIFWRQYGTDALLNNIDYNQRTTKENRIPNEIITAELILGLRYVKDLRNIIIKKKLNVGAKGPFRTADIRCKNFNAMKIEVASILFNIE